MNNTLIVLVTHSSFKDICELYLNLFHKYWPDCPYDFVIGVIGKQISFENERVFFCGENATLPNCILEISKSFNYDYYMCMLGDAFINDYINTTNVINLINHLKKDQMDYCCLIPRKAYRFHKKSVNKIYRYILKNDIYCVSFIAFIANKKFIQKEFSEKVTDLDFEKKYISEKQTSTSDYYPNMVILNNNIFNIYPGIEKGKWNLRTLYLIKSKNHEFLIPNRPKISIVKYCRNLIGSQLQIILSKRQRIYLKKFLSKVGMNFTIDK